MKSLVFIAFALLFFATNAQAYVGPGLGVGVIGAIVGVLLTIVMAIVGIFWYPIKRMFKKGGDEEETLEDSDNQQANSVESTEAKEEQQ